MSLHNIVWICMILKFRTMELYFLLLLLFFFTYLMPVKCCCVNAHYISSCITNHPSVLLLTDTGPCRLWVVAAPVHTLTRVHRAPHSHQHFAGSDVNFFPAWWVGSGVALFNSHFHDEAASVRIFIISTLMKFLSSVSLYLIFALWTYSAHPAVHQLQACVIHALSLFDGFLL